MKALRDQLDVLTARLGNARQSYIDNPDYGLELSEKVDSGMKERRNERTNERTDERRDEQTDE